ncbi:MAG: allantoinase AllB [Aigarchaeota archaeon]|nr:allantoinase AllB [Aigarchaeota archaeon]MDW7986350.1 allantoinase AllB [Nitrososphaerota archaeon]
MSGSLLVKNGKLVSSSGIRELDILIVDGVIEAIGRDLKYSGVEVLDAKGFLIFPGVVDEHVHMREPGLTYKEDFETGTTAAAVGGVTTVLEMPNTIPPVDSSSRLREKKEILKGKAYVDYGLYGVLHDSNIDEIEDMWFEGAIGFKVFMGPTTGDIPSPPDKIIIEALEKSCRNGFTLAFHAENYELVKYYSEKVKNSGRNDPLVHSDARPNICEEEAVSRILIYTKKTRGRALIVHMSTSESVKLLAKAKIRGVHVFGETCPQYLFMTSEDHLKYGSLVKINPPLRSRKDQKSLWNGIKNNILDCVASDHAPHTVEEKTKNIWEAASGFIGVETLFPLMLDAALRGVLPLEKIPLILSENPAKIFGIYPKKGSLSIGAEGDLVIVDPEGEHVIQAEKLHSKHKITPYDGWRLRGKIKYTILRGVKIVEEGEITSKKALGRDIKPTIEE